MNQNPNYTVHPQAQPATPLLEQADITSAGIQQTNMQSTALRQPSTVPGNMHNLQLAVPVQTHSDLNPDAAAYTPAPASQESYAELLLCRHRIMVSWNLLRYSNSRCI